MKTSNKPNPLKELFDAVLNTHHAVQHTRGGVMCAATPTQAQRAKEAHAAALLDHNDAVSAFVDSTDDLARNRDLDPLLNALREEVVLRNREATDLLEKRGTSPFTPGDQVFISTAAGSYIPGPGGHAATVERVDDTGAVIVRTARREQLAFNARGECFTHDRTHLTLRAVSK
jgi:hypothetical protein